MCDFSPRLVNSTFGNYWAVPSPNTSRWCSSFALDDGPNNFSEAEKFFLVGWSQLRRLYQVPRGNSFSACDFFFAYFFGPTAFALACHGFANAVTLRMGFWECFKSPDAPFAPFWMSMICKMDGIMAGHAQEGVTKETVAGRVPSILQSILVAKCHACHVKRRWVSPSATPATQSGAASRGQPSVISATPTRQNEGGCRQVPRLPRETTVDVTKCHACHAKWRGVTGDQAHHQSQPSVISAMPATQNKVDVAKCHACHVKSRWMPPSATPATQGGAASRGTKHAT